VFETLSERLGAILDKLTRRGALTEADVGEAMREVRRALLEADVALDVVRDFTEKVREKAVGQEVVRSITPGQMVVKIVHDELVRVLGSDAQAIDLAATPPVVMMMVGLAVLLAGILGAVFVTLAVMTPIVPFALVALVVWALMQHSRAANVAPN